LGGFRGRTPIVLRAVAAGGGGDGGGGEGGGSKGGSGKGGGADGGGNARAAAANNMC